jgi:hypothetical protein
VPTAGPTNELTSAPDYQALLQERVRARGGGLWDVRSTLRHFALITYALPAERLARYIPAQRFEIPTFPIGGQHLALMSAVPFWDHDFRFVHLAPWLTFAFGQTNYRVYVRDRETDQQVAWFFGTTLGSPVVYIARTLWRIPWHPARYRLDCRWNPARRAYDRYACDVASAWGAAHIRLRDTGEPCPVQPGFTSSAEMQFILTHPVTGFYWRTDGRLGTYSVWHKPMTMTLGAPEHLYFGLYERLGLLTRAEMQRPHSIFLSPQVEFDVHLPPRRVGTLRQGDPHL